MNPLVFMILFAERELEIERQRHRDKRAEAQTLEPAIQSKRKSRRQVSNCSHPQKPCECS